MTLSRGLRGMIGLSLLSAILTAAGLWRRRGARRRANADDRRRRLEHGLPDQHGRPGCLPSSRARQRSSSSTSTAPGRASATIWRARSTSSTRRGRPKPTRNRRPRRKGIDWSRFLVGYDGITLVVNPKNDFVKSLSVEQLKKLWAPASTVKTWKDVDPAWPDREIILYSPDNDSGTFEFFTEAIVGKPKKPA